MSSNVHEDPNLKMNVRYSEGLREDRVQREERLVDIDEGADHFPKQDGAGGHAEKHLTAVKRYSFKAAALILGLLLVAGVIVLSRLYISINFEKYQLSNSYTELLTSYKELQTSYDNLDSSYCRSQGTEDQTEKTISEWKRFQCSCYYKSTEMKNWTDSRTDCQKRGADLVMINNKEENDFVSKLAEHGASWIGLQSVKKNSWEQNWKWVDESTPKYTVWKVGVNMNAAEGNTAYIDQEGKWIPTNNGSKQWNCEKQIY